MHAAREDRILLFRSLLRFSKGSTATLFRFSSLFPAAARSF